MYNTQVTHKISTSLMYDDYDLDYTQASDYTYDLDEYYEACVQTYAHLDNNLDEDYARDSHDYATLAYNHYA